MASLVDLPQETRPFSSADPKYSGLMKNLQGNILNSHGRHFAVHIFFKLNPAVQDAKKAIVELRSRNFILSAAEQAAQTVRAKATPGTQEVFGTILFSAAGLKKLGLAIPNGFGNSLNPPGPPVAFMFDQPMSAAAGELGDDPAKEWEDKYKDEIDGPSDRRLREHGQGQYPVDPGRPVRQGEGSPRDSRKGSDGRRGRDRPRARHRWRTSASTSASWTASVNPCSWLTIRRSQRPRNAFDPSAGLIDLVVVDPFTGRR